MFTLCAFVGEQPYRHDPPAAAGQEDPGVAAPRAGNRGAGRCRAMAREHACLLPCGPSFGGWTVPASGSPEQEPRVSVVP